jgi:tetratricopeptide (TPR) repeat protein
MTIHDDSLRRAQQLYLAGDLAAARARYQELLLKEPRHLEALHTLGIIEGRQGNWQRSAEYLSRAIEAGPGNASAFGDLGVALKALQQWDAALRSLDRAVALKSDYPEAHSNRGNVLRELGRLDAAVASYDHAIAVRPDYAEAHYNRGVAHQDLNKFDAALASYDRAIELRPNFAAAHVNRGVVLEHLHRLDAALDSYDRAISIRGDDARAFSNRGNVQRALQRVADAIDSCDRAVAIEPDNATAHLNRGLARLLAGDFAQGWKDYEWRWKDGKSLFRRDYRAFAQPQWSGQQALAGKTILIHAEQGLGDTIQFCRYVPMVRELGAEVIFEVQPPLMRLLRGVEGQSQLLSRGVALPNFDYHCPLMSLPLAFGTTLGNIPGTLPYLAADPERRQLWRRRLGERTKPRVGLVWSGGFRPDQPEIWSVNARRNVPLARLSALRNSGLEFYSLQKGQPAESELPQWNERSPQGPPLIDCAGDLADFADTAALIEQLDLIISVDTSTAHLAGALGKPVWILNRFDCCWRWLLGRADSPWYPSARLYRQSTPGDWDGVVERVRQDLLELL